jgi:hypothetical protein
MWAQFVARSSSRRRARPWRPTVRRTAGPARVVKQSRARVSNRVCRGTHPLAGPGVPEVDQFAGPVQVRYRSTRSTTAADRYGSPWVRSRNGCAVQYGQVHVERNAWRRTRKSTTNEFANPEPHAVCPRIGPIRSSKDDRRNRMPREWSAGGSSAATKRSFRWLGLPTSRSTHGRMQCTLVGRTLSGTSVRAPTYH